MLKDYESTYLAIYGQSYKDYIVENVMQEPKLILYRSIGIGIGDALFFVLFQMKNDLVFGSLGAVFGMCPASALKNFKSFSLLVIIHKKILVYVR